MKSILNASVALLLAGVASAPLATTQSFTATSAAVLVASIAFAPLATAQTKAPMSQPAVDPSSTYAYAVPWVPRQLALSPYQSYGYRPKPAPTAPIFLITQPAPTAPQSDPYPPGWDALYGGGDG